MQFKNAIDFLKYTSNISEETISNVHQKTERISQYILDILEMMEECSVDVLGSYTISFQHQGCGFSTDLLLLKYVVTEYMQRKDSGRI